MASVTALDPAAERRTADRRRRPTPMLSRHWLRGRRRGGRRTGETVDVYVDRYTRMEWAGVAGLVALAAVDCAWTLAHLARGVEEANPVLAWIWRHSGTLGFTAAKMVATVAAALVLLLHARFRWTRRLLPIALGVYVLLLAVHALTEFELLPR
jgi:hypothetical protein